MAATDPYGTRAELLPGVSYHRLGALADRGIGDVSRLPVTIKILLENSVRNADPPRRSARVTSRRSHAGTAPARPSTASARSCRPASCSRTSPVSRPSSTSPRCDLPSLVPGGDPMRIDPLVPVDLVVDHSVQVDAFGNREAYERNIVREYERNRERYSLLRWAQQAFQGLSRRAAGDGDRPPDQPRVPRAGRAGSRHRWRAHGAAGHAGRHRFAHADGQRRRRARLGRRRHRGRGLHARSAALPARAGGGRRAVSTTRCPREPPPPTSCSRSRSCSASTASSTSSSSSAAAGSARCRCPTAQRSPTCRRNSAPPRRCSPSTHERSNTCAAPAATPSTSTSSSATRRNRACSAPTTRRSPPSARWSSSTSRAWCRASPAPSGPRIVSRSRVSGSRSATSGRSLRSGRQRSHRRR